MYLSAVQQDRLREVCEHLHKSREGLELVTFGLGMVTEEDQQKLAAMYDHVCKAINIFIVSQYPR